MEQKLNQAISFVEEAVKRAMELRQRGEKEVEKALGELKAKKEKLEKIKEELKEILDSEIQVEEALV